MTTPEIFTVWLNVVVSVLLLGFAARHLVHARTFKIKGTMDHLLAIILVVAGVGSVVVMCLLLFSDAKRTLAPASVLFGGFCLVLYHFVFRFFVRRDESTQPETGTKP